MERLGFWPLLILFIPAMVGLRGPLFLWFDLWGPVLRPILAFFSVPPLW
jgi:hypothetical protein